MTVEVKSDYLHDVLKWVDHNRYKVAGVVIGLILAICIVGCQPMVIGLDGGDKVNSEQLAAQILQGDLTLNEKILAYDAKGKQLEAETFAHNALVEQRQTTMTEKIEMQRKVIETIGGMALKLISGGSIGATEAVSTILPLVFGFVGLGAVGDKRRTDRVLNDLKTDKKIEKEQAV